MGLLINPDQLVGEDAECLCSICQIELNGGNDEEEFNEENGQIVELPCGHYMHLGCFNEYLINNVGIRNGWVKCPLCRRGCNV